MGSQFNSRMGNYGQMSSQAGCCGNINNMPKKTFNCGASSNIPQN